MQFIKKNREAQTVVSKPQFRLKSWVTAFAVGMTVLTSASVYASEAEEVSNLMRQDRYDQALARAEAYLATNPSDAQMRFLKGLILTERKKENEAITVFTKLTEDFPELPEPYNNLAVLYAGKGDYDKARESLEMAIRTHPSYATAYENLGDVYAKLASQSYDKALQLDGRNATAQTKLSMVRNIVQGTVIDSPAPAPVQVAAAPAPVAPAPAPTSAPAPAPSAKPPSIALPPISSNTTASVAPSASSNDNAEAPAQTIGADRKVLAAVERWAKAWSDQDMEAYLDSYSQSFDPPRGMSRSAWEKQREQRIVGKERIRVEIDNPLITLTGDTAVVKFKQSYFSDRLNNVANKTLTLQLEGSQWRITNEQVGG